MILSRTGYTVLFFERWFRSRALLVCCLLNLRLLLLLGGVFAIIRAGFVNKNFYTCFYAGIILLLLKKIATNLLIFALPLAH